MLLIDLGSGKPEWLRMRASWVSPEDLPGIPLRQDWVLNPELSRDS